MPIQIVHKFICDQCNETIELAPQTIENVYEESVNISLPDAWKRFENRLLCPKHKVEKVCLIDSKKIRRFVL